MTVALHVVEPRPGELRQPAADRVGLPADGFGRLADRPGGGGRLGEEILPALGPQKLVGLAEKAVKTGGRCIDPCRQLLRLGDDCVDIGRMRLNIGGEIIDVVGCFLGVGNDLVEILGGVAELAGKG